MSKVKINKNLINIGIGIIFYLIIEITVLNSILSNSRSLNKETFVYITKLYPIQTLFMPTLSFINIKRDTDLKTPN